MLESPAASKRGNRVGWVPSDDLSLVCGGSVLRLLVNVGDGRIGDVEPRGRDGAECRRSCRCTCRGCSCECTCRGIVSMPTSICMSGCMGKGGGGESGPPVEVLASGCLAGRGRGGEDTLHDSDPVILVVPNPEPITASYSMSQRGFRHVWAYKSLGVGNRKHFLIGAPSPPPIAQCQAVSGVWMCAPEVLQCGAYLQWQGLGRS